MRENASITFVRAVTPIHHDTGRLKGYGFAIVQPELFDVIARALNEAYTLGKHGNQSSDEI
jgi:hypothetical protein